MRIAVDAMGGDNGPPVIVAGAVAAVRHDHAVHVILVGDEARLRPMVPPDAAQSISFQKASQVVEMGESPMAAAKRKDDSSLAVATRLVRDGAADACLSAGNTGAATLFALFKLGRIEGVDRPGIATVFPTAKKPLILIDAGANVDCRPRHLADFAIMGAAYVPAIQNIIPGDDDSLAPPERPTVGLLSIGEEDSKGNELSKATVPLLRAGAGPGGYTFFGNVEGRDIAKGTVDVIVCDGFTGNVALKVAEGCATVFTSELKSALLSTPRSKMGAWLLSPALKLMRLRLDYNQYGGAVLLGVNGICVIAHGSANERAIASAIGIAKQAVKADVPGTIRAAMLTVPEEVASVTVSA